MVKLLVNAYMLIDGDIVGEYIYVTWWLSGWWYGDDSYLNYDLSIVWT